MDIVRALEKRITELGSAKAFAAELGVSAAYISMVRVGTKRPSRKILKALGFERRVTYKRVANGQA